MIKSTYLTSMIALLVILSSVGCNPKENNTTSNDSPVSANSDTLIVYDTVYVNNQIDPPQKHVYISASKANVLYVGVENPIHIAALGIASDDLSVSASGVGAIVKKRGAAAYDVTPTSPGVCNITAVGPEFVVTSNFRAKRIPDPIARLSSSSGGDMGSGEFKAQGGVGAFLDYFDFEATCAIAGFNLVYLAKRQDAVEVVNSGARYVDAARRLVSRAKPGDIYIFDNVRAKCPGDKATRKINSMVFFIK